jgi:hypothetical protein
MHFALKTPIAIEQKTEGKNSRFRVFEKKFT